MINITMSSGVTSAHQRFSQRINGYLVGFEIDYVSYTEYPYWVANIRINGSPAAVGVPLNPGAVQDFGEFGRLVFVGDEPTLDNLGKSNKLVWIPAE